MDFDLHFQLRTGHALPPMGLGTSQLLDDAAECVVNAIEHGQEFADAGDLPTICDQDNIDIQAYSPLTSRRRLDNETHQETASENEVSTPQLLLCWALQEAVAPLPKADRVDHQRENLGAFEVELDSTTMNRLDELNEHDSALGSLGCV